MRAVFGLDLSAALIAAVAEHGEREYPREACGVLLGPRHGGGPLRLERLRNVQDHYHQRDPERFARTAHDAFRVDELERLGVLERADRDGLVERAVYHSHCDAGAYFSPEDRAMAVIDGLELLPGVVHLVVSIVAGRARAMAAFLYDREERRFLEQRVRLQEMPAWPDVASRAMTGRVTPGLIAPVGGALVGLRADVDEQVALSSRADAAVELAPADVRELRRLALGLWSPALGFASGELGAPRAVTPRPALAPGRIIELRRGGAPVGALRLGAGSSLSGETVAYAAVLAPADVDAADVRAELVRRGARRVVATVGPSGAITLTADGAPVEVPPIAASDDPVAQAIMAQNLGATVLLGPPRSLPRGVTLAVESPDAL